ncbi:MAG: hypothetical protein HGA19_19410 [Oscillochloris sp.]|nr:hypothetical protein [Oscillochloris sp.]
MEDNGDFVISWVSYGFHGLEGQVYARHYESDGTPRGAEFLVNTATAASNPWSPSVAMDSNGNFVISWERGDLNKTDVDIYAQRYGADDSPRGNTFQVNTFTAGVQTLPTVAMDTDGDFVISWQSNGQDDFAGGIYAQRYGANGNPRSAEFPVSSYLHVAQGYPAVAMDANGDFVISWESSGQDGSAEGIYAQRFAQAPDMSLDASMVQPVVILENSTMSVPFRVSSTRTAAEKLVLSATTISNTELLPTSGLTIGGSGTSRTLTMIPAKTSGLAKPNSYGSAVVRITASDPSNNTSTSLDLPITVQAPPWLVMLYLAGDDYGSLSSGVDDILTELRQMPYNPAMRLVVLADQKGGGNTRAFVRDPSGLTQITPKDDTTLSILSGELDTGSRDTLKRYISWATTTFPDYQHTFLAVVDHGGGWAPDFTRGGAQPSAGRKVKSGGWRGMSMDLNEGGGTSLSTYDTGKALRDGLSSSEKIDVLFFDACLMGMTESAYEVRDKASYLVAAQNLLFQEEDLRTYSAYLDPDILTPETTPELLATKVVSTYNTIDSYNGRIRQAANPFSIAAIDLTKLDDLAQHVNSLAQALLSAYPNTDGIALYHALLPAYTQAQKFDYDSDEKIEQETDGYVDLGHLAQLLHDDLSLPASVRTNAGYVTSAVTAAVVAKQTVSGVYQSDVADQQIWDLDHSSGLSIYAPLGEEDWRPTRILTESVQLPAGCEAASESQLTYYVQDTQLQFTSTGAPGLPWGTLLTRIRPNVPRIHASCLDPEDETDGKIVDTSPFHSPDRVALYHQVLLPFIKH